MAEGRGREAWDHTASLLTAIASIFAGKGHRPSIADFHPYMRCERKELPEIKVGVDFLIAMAKNDKDGIAKALLKGQGGQSQDCQKERG